MSYKIKVRDAGRFEDLAANETVIKVDYSIVQVAENEGEEDTVVLERSEAFNLATTKEEIEESLQKVLATFIDEESRKEEQELIDRKYAQADETIEALKELSLE